MTGEAGAAADLRTVFLTCVAPALTADAMACAARVIDRVVRRGTETLGGALAFKLLTPVGFTSFLAIGSNTYLFAMFACERAQRALEEM